MDLEQRIREGRMTLFQVVTVSICMLAIISDGYDIIAIAVTAPAIAREWAIDPVNLGTLISSATAGMVVGALVLAPLGDRIGRRLVALIGQALVTLGMALAWLAPGFELLLGARFVTGIGIGAVTAVMGVIVAEFSTRKWLGFTMALYSAGTGLGGFLGGLIAGQAIPTWGWQSVFLIGAVINVVILVACIAGLPESIQFLATRRAAPGATLDRLNRLLARMGREPVADLPRRTSEKTDALATLRRIVSPALLLVTLLITLSYCILMLTFYVNLGWTPQLITRATGDEQLGILFGTIAPFGGMIGGLLYGVVSLKVGTKPLTLASLVVAVLGATALAVAMAQGDISIIVPFAMAIGFGAAMGGFFALIPASYPAAIRSSSFGWIMGFGRLAAVLGPILAGAAVAAEWSGATIFAIMAALLALGTLLLLPIRRERAGEPGAPPTGEVAGVDAAGGTAAGGTAAGGSPRPATASDEPGRSPIGATSTPRATHASPAPHAPHTPLESDATESRR